MFHLKMAFFIYLLFLINPILNSEVLIYPIKLEKSTSFITDDYFYFSMNFYGTYRNVRVSLGSSEFLIGVNKPEYNKTDINIKYDNIYPEKPTSGNIATGYFNISKTDNNVFLNVLYNNSFYEPKLGLSRWVKYDDPSIEYSYDLDFMSQLIKQGVIEKHYIYLTPFFDIEGKTRNDISLELGRLPIYFEDKYFYSYMPLNNLYPRKWSAKLSHIIIGDIKKENIHGIFADVIFTDSYRKTSYIPETLRTFFRTIFVDKMDCEFSSSSYIKCPKTKIETTKFYLVFNGYAHLIPNSLLFYSSVNETHKYCTFQFTSDINYISIDSYILGVYHRLYDGENDTVRFVYPNDSNFIVDVEEYTGYENRNGTKKEIPSIEYLRDYERRLKKEELMIKETLIQIEKDKKIIREKTESLNNKEIELQKYEEELKKKEEEMKEKIEKIEEYEKEINDLKNEIKNKNETIQNLETENANIKKENDNLKDEIKNKNEIIKNLETENANIKKENDNLKDEIKKKDETINNLETENANLKKELEKLKNEIKEKNDKITNLDESLNSEKKRSLIELIFIIIILIISIITITVIVIKCKSKSNKAEIDQIMNIE